jgi:hypothetical protein
MLFSVKWFSNHFYIMQKAEFSQIVFSRTLPDNFAFIIEFQPIPSLRLSKEMRIHFFVTGLILHALDTVNQYRHLIPSQLCNAQFDLHELISSLSSFLESFQFTIEYIHPSILFFREDFTTLIKDNFLELHRHVFHNIHE